MGVSNMVKSLMNLVEMLMKEACEDPEVEDNKSLRQWIIVRVIYLQ